MGDTTTIEVDGYTFGVTIERDNDSGPPWKECDGHGDVRQALRPHWQGEGVSDKKSGERPMNKPDRNHQQFYYDWAGACKKARAEGWNAQPYDAPNRVHRAVLADFKYMQDYLAGDWEYVTVEVTLANRTEYTSCVCGVEMHNDYHLEFAEELAREVVGEYLDDMEKGQLKGMETTGASTPEGER
jgi:ketopantoate reductase